MTSLKELAIIFLKLGTFAFGGPAAHIAMMEKEFVEKRQWLSQGEFLTMMGFTNLIPGPNSTEMALHIGYLRAKGKGMLIAGLCFILPATLMVLGLSYLLVNYGSLPSVNQTLLAVGPIMLGLILSVILKFSKPLLKSYDSWILLIVILISTFYMNELLVLLFSGLVMFIISKRRVYALEPISLATLFWIFFKIGSLLYGSGYVLLAFIKTEFMDLRQVLTLNQLMDALTLGQLTPGPVFTTATAIGYMLHGWLGGIIATIAIFMPAFILVYFLHPVFVKMSQNASLKSFLEGLKLASLGLMIKVAFDVAWISRDNIFLILAPISLILLIKTKINPTVLIVGGVGLGYIVSLL
jgi:chromate transporter